MAKGPSKAVREKTNELRKKLAQPDMKEFDRFMGHLVRVPKRKIDQVIADKTKHLR